MEGPAFVPGANGSRNGTLTLRSGHCGPPTCANGGLVAGWLAQRLQGPVEVTLRRPIPLEQPVTVEHLGEAVMIRLGNEILALAQPTTPPEAPPPAPSWADTLEAFGLRTPPDSHPFPTCFVCGPARDPGDGLRILPGPLSNGRGVAAPWIPDESTAGSNGLVRPEILWASLDCPGGFAALQGSRPRPIVLGRIAAQIRLGLRPGDPCIVHGWRINSDGRKHEVGTALYSVEGEAWGVARAVWVEV